MSASLIIGIILTVAALVLLWFAVLSLTQLKKTLASVDKLVLNLNDRIGPALDDLHGLIEQANTELEKLDDVVSGIKDVSDKVSVTTRVVHELISSPLVKAAAISTGAREVIKRIVRK